MPHWRVLELPVVRDRRARYLNPRSLRRRMGRVLAALAITLVHVGSRGLADMADWVGHFAF